MDPDPDGPWTPKHVSRDPLPANQNPIPLPRRRFIHNCRSQYIVLRDISQSSQCWDDPDYKYRSADSRSEALELLITHYNLLFWNKKTGAHIPVTSHKLTTILLDSLRTWAVAGLSQAKRRVGPWKERPTSFWTKEYLKTLKDSAIYLAKESEQFPVRQGEHVCLSAEVKRALIDVKTGSTTNDPAGSECPEMASSASPSSPYSETNSDVDDTSPPEVRANTAKRKDEKSHEPARPKGRPEPERASRIQSPPAAEESPAPARQCCSPPSTSLRRYSRMTGARGPDRVNQLVDEFEDSSKVSVALKQMYGDIRVAVEGLLIKALQLEPRDKTIFCWQATETLVCLYSCCWGPDWLTSVQQYFAKSQSHYVSAFDFFTALVLAALYGTTLAANPAAQMSLPDGQAMTEWLRQVKHEDLARPLERLLANGEHEQHPSCMLLWREFETATRKAWFGFRQGQLEDDAKSLAHEITAALYPHIKELMDMAKSTRMLNVPQECVSTFENALAPIVTTAKEMKAALSLLTHDHYEHSFTWPAHGDVFDPRTMHPKHKVNTDTRHQVVYTIQPGLIANFINEPESHDVVLLKAEVVTQRAGESQSEATEIIPNNRSAKTSSKTHADVAAIT